MVGVSSVHTIPVTIEPTPGEMVDGIFEIQGVLRVDGDTIHLEYRSINAVQQARSPVRKLKVMLVDLAGVEFRKGLFSSRLVLRGTSLKIFETLPWAEDECLVLKIARRYRHEVARAAWDLQTILENRKLPPRTRPPER